MNPRAHEISDEFLAHLKEDLVHRRVEQGMARLEENRQLLSALVPAQSNSGRFVGQLAQWVDIGYQRPAIVRVLVQRFSKHSRSHLPLIDYLHLRLAEGMLAMSDEATEQAIRHLDFLLALDDECADRELMSIAYYWKGRCLRMKGEYDQALEYAAKGKDLASRLGHETMAAVMRVLESWLCFQKGNLQQASRILQEVESTLRRTDDHLTLGNIYSSHGRIARRQGRYQRAAESFEAAIGEYRQRDPQHRNVARSLNNLASVKRLIAVELSRKMDEEILRRRKKAGAAPSSAGRRQHQSRLRVEQLRKQVMAALDEAAMIYAQYRYHHGLGSVRLNYGYLYLDGGDLELAEQEAATAFALGEEKRDFILMARARLLRCMAENTRVNEGIGDGLVRSARIAQDAADEAATLARQTQDRRLLADAFIWQGLTAANRYFDDIDSARQSYDRAVALCRDYESDDSSAHIRDLREKLLRVSTVNPVLRAWSQGSVGDKSFRQVTEEFAEIVIPKVWEREERKISRVAARLSISPKKVRRILNRVGKRKPGNSSSA